MPNFCPSLFHPSLVAAAVLVGLSTIGFDVNAEIYRWQDENGNTVYSDKHSSDKAHSAPTSDRPVNYFTAANTMDKPAKANADTSAALATLEAVDDGDEDKVKPLTEAQCQQLYQRSCDQVHNWQTYARKACGTDSRCDDPAFLDRKYRPRTIEELREIARRSAARNNRNDDNIEEFLKKKYSNYCANQSAMYCRQQRRSHCMDMVKTYCQDPRGLDDILAKYDNLSPAEKKQIIEKAKAMVTANGDNALSYDQMISSLIDILISQVAMGI